MSVVEYANNGPWKCRLAGACGDILDSRSGHYYGSMLYLDALEVVKQLNQRHRWLVDADPANPALTETTR